MRFMIVVKARPASEAGEMPSIENAVAWLRRCPKPMPDDSEIEIRPIRDAAEFAAEVGAP